MSIEVEVGGIYEKAADLTPAGTVSAFAGINAPSGWLLCDGSAVSRTTYSDLYDVILDRFGSGDGNTTFNIPDMRGIFPRGAGSNGSMTKADGNVFDGGAVGLQKNDKMQQITGQTGVIFGGSGGSGCFTSEYYNKDGTNNDSELSRYKINFDSADSLAQGGARTGDETAPASLSMNYIIKT